MTLGYDTLFLSAVCAVILVSAHLATPKLRHLPLISHSGFTSFSGGFAAAFVFLHMLPGLIESKDALGAVLHAHFVGSHLVDTGVFLLALAGFIVFSDCDAGVGKKQGRLGANPAELSLCRSFLSVSTTQ